MVGWTGEGLLEAAAENLAGWHESSVRALGFASAQGRWWWTSPTPGPWIYFTAIGTRAPSRRGELDEALAELAVHLDDPAGSYEAVCDSFGALRPPTPRAHGPHARPVVRPSGRTATAERGLPRRARHHHGGHARRTGRVRGATCLAFAAPPPVAPFDIHAPGVLEDPAMHVLVGQVDDEVVSGAMVYVAAGVVGIYGVGTVPGHRHQGYARALTRACLAIEPMAPAILQPSAEASSMYRHIGLHRDRCLHPLGLSRDAGGTTKPGRPSAPRPAKPGALAADGRGRQPRGRPTTCWSDWGEGQPATTGLVIGLWLVVAVGLGVLASASAGARPTTCSPSPARSPSRPLDMLQPRFPAANGATAQVVFHSLLGPSPRLRPSAAASTPASPT